jgi:archaeal flagellar protein FlaJ
MNSVFFQRIAKASPSIKLKLKQAGIEQKPEEFIKRSVIGALYMSFGLLAALFLGAAKTSFPKIILLFMFPIVFAVMIAYMMKLPDIKISKREKDISKEIVFVGRFIIIELESGVPLYNTLINTSKNFEIIGTYFKEITDKVDLGTTIEDALNEAVEFIPSNDFRKIMWQIINSMRTGSNISKSLYSVVDQITKDQMTEVNKYGKKLNPLAMFYMIVAVIMPSLGITMLIILSSFIELKLSLGILMVICGFLALIQIIFISLVKFSRPPVEF